jgi:hypothetical protein
MPRMPARLVLRVFLSSPGDVVEERKLARDTLQALEGSHLLKGKMRFEIVAWDDEHAAAPMDARESPQVSVNRYTGSPADCDLTVLILWSRIGTRLPPGLTRPNGSPYESGTVWEYEDALAADKPVFVYRRTEKPKADLDDTEFDKKRTQYAAVKAFVGQFENPDGSLRAGFTTYATPADFGKILRQHLEAFVNERMGAQTPAAAAQIEPDDPRVIHIVTLIDELARKNRQIDEKEAEIKALREANEALRRAAIARTLTAAAQPEASAEALAAGAALEIGNTRPAEVLLREQEQTAAQSLASGVPEAVEQRHQAAELAREQGALAVGRDVRAALAAYLRAAEYEPNDTWTRFYIGDLHLQLGDSNAAIRSLQAGMAIAQKLAAADPSNSQWQTDVAVLAWKIGTLKGSPQSDTERRAVLAHGLTILESLTQQQRLAPTQAGWPEIFRKAIAELS